MQENFIQYKEGVERRLHTFISELIYSFKLSDKKFSDILETPLSEAQQIISGKRKIDVSQLMKLSHTFHFSIEAASLGKVDLVSLREHFKGNFSHLSEKYSVGAFSKKLNAINLFNVIEEIKKTEFKNYVQEYFQAGDNIYADKNGFINVNFFCDVFRLLKRNGFSEKDFSYIGARSVDTAIQSNFGKQLIAMETPSNLFQVYFESFIGDLDRNNKYEIVKLDQNECIVNSFEAEEVCDLFRVNHVGSRERCIYRAGALRATTRFIGHSDCDVFESKCVFRGDPHCQFRISYNHVIAAHRRKGLLNEVFH